MSNLSEVSWTPSPIDNDNDNDNEIDIEDGG